MQVLLLLILIVRLIFSVCKYITADNFFVYRFIIF